MIDPGPDLLVCDEGHLLKNEKTSLTNALKKIRTLRRIVLTGTPLQNSLKEYYCMLNFVKPQMLGTPLEFRNLFIKPISNGQFKDSYRTDIELMKRRSFVLHQLLDVCVQRLDFTVLAAMLPPKHEYVLHIRLTNLQINLYQVLILLGSNNSIFSFDI